MGAGKGYGNFSNTQGGRKQIVFNGKVVTQDNNLFDPHAIDKQGRSNIQRMQDGLAPIGYDGKSVTIHHIDQTNNGPVVEVSGSTHTQMYGALHKNTGQFPSLIDRQQFNSWRNDYWAWRARSFID
jgi:hypothetical protein